VTGDAGTGSQTFTYDALNRVTGASGLGTAFTYTYDRNGNRKTKSDGTTTLTSTYDRTDQLRTIGNGVLADATFTYNAYGDLTAKVERPTGGAWQTTTHTYDLAGKLTGIDGPAAGSGDAAAFTFDALGRFRTRVLSGSTDTYSYLGTTETVLRIANSGGTTTDSLVDSAGNRLGVLSGSTLNWFLPDPHGNVAAALSSDEATVVNALRYDPWGDLAASGSGGGTAVGASYWKYQGRLDVAPAGTDAGALYDMSARFYSPSLGAFTQLDSVMGSAQDPRSMNRFLYAHANPATLIDPTGHAACPGGMPAFDGQQCVGQSAADLKSDPSPSPYPSGTASGATGSTGGWDGSAPPPGGFGMATPRYVPGPTLLDPRDVPRAAPDAANRAWAAVRESLSADPAAYFDSEYHNWATTCGSFPDACARQPSCLDGIDICLALLASVAIGPPGGKSTIGIVNDAGVTSPRFRPDGTPVRSPLAKLTLDRIRQLALDPATGRRNVREALAAARIEALTGRVERYPGGVGADFRNPATGKLYDIFSYGRGGTHFSLSQWQNAFARKLRTNATIALDLRDMSPSQLPDLVDALRNLTPEQASRVLIIPDTRP
jgi:RHS repeat-associated protein